jgi:hypothetical protein
MSKSLTTINFVPTKVNEYQIDYILVDGSGSMIDKWWNMMDALDEYVSGVKAEQTNTEVIVQVFDSGNLDLIVRKEHVRDWQSPRTPGKEIPLPGGGTPLYDAINLLGRKMRDMDPPRASIVIVTDGYNTYSQHTDETQAKAIIEWMKAKGWQVIMIGANFDNSTTAKALGVDRNMAIGVEKSHLKAAAKASPKSAANTAEREKTWSSPRTSASNSAAT